MRYPGFIGPAYTLTSVDAAADRLVNLYYSPIEVPNQKGSAYLLSTPGLAQFSDLGDDGPVRGLVTCYGVGTGGTPRVFAVSGATSGQGKLYELASNGTATDRGNLSSSMPAGTIRFAYNETELMVAIVGVKPYRFRFSDNNLAQITGAPQALFPIVFLDGYFIGASGADGERDRFYISALKDGNTWDALDFGEADACPDIITDMIAWNRELFLMGQIGGQVFFNSGNVDFPFEPIPGRFIPAGCGSSFALQDVEGTLIWMSHEDKGRGVFYKTEGYKPVRISTHAVEQAVRGYADLHLTQAWSYQDEGHLFYVAYFPTASRTWVYDLTTGLWHERMFLNGSTEEAHLGTCHTFAFWEATPFKGKHLVGSRADGIVYEMNPATYQDAGGTLRKIRRAPHLHNENKRIFFHSLEVEMETGETNNPTVNLKYSNDGGHSFSSALAVTAGASADYKARAKWNRLGSARDRVFEVYTDAAMRVAITDAYLRATPGAH